MTPTRLRRLAQLLLHSQRSSARASERERKITSSPSPRTDASGPPPRPHPPAVGTTTRDLVQSPGAALGICKLASEVKRSRDARSRAPVAHGLYRAPASAARHASAPAPVPPSLGGPTAANAFGVTLRSSHASLVSSSAAAALVPVANPFGVTLKHHGGSGGSPVAAPAPPPLPVTADGPIAIARHPCVPPLPFPRRTTHRPARHSRSVDGCVRACLRVRLRSQLFEHAGG